MMNKLTTLFAMILGLALVVPTIEAAAPAAPDQVQVDPAAATPGFFARRKQNLFEAKDWACEHKVKAGCITAGSVAAIVVVAEVVKNGKKSWFPRLYKKLTGKSAVHNRLADIKAAAELAKKGN